MGSLVAYITDATRRNFQPMNANFGLMPELTLSLRGRARKLELARRALTAMDAWLDSHGLRLKLSRLAAA